MPAGKQESSNAQIKDFAEAFSIHAKYSNRIWLSVILSSSVIVFPKIEGGSAKLPFELSSVPLHVFYPIGFIIISILIIAFGQAYAHLHTISRYVQNEFIDIQPDNEKEDLRRLFGFMQSSSFLRVFPLVESASRLKIGSKLIIKVYFIFLKILVNIIIVLIPAILWCYSIYLMIDNEGNIYISIILSPFFVGTCFSIFQVLYNEYKHIRLVIDSKFG